ncbi:uncharacterized protein LOC122807735 [Protopterus annectens]|uniref:uncharacterized protein LOC122807735 n=1 Tax=Protopterus annectens TaxID=7888 RepID=UPI001CFA3F62|nr:uncharacterized protein LOC122807735 [Protopterus annectens]
MTAIKHNTVNADWIMDHFMNGQNEHPTDCVASLPTAGSTLPQKDVEYYQETDAEWQKQDVPVSGFKKRKLVLHVDVNNTILVSDTATEQGTRAALSSYFSSVIWGKINQLDKWEWLSDVPSVLPPCDEAVNFYSVFGKDEDFFDSTEGRCFKSIFVDHLQKLEWPGPADEILSVTGEDGKQYHRILPSFFWLIKTLCLQGREFSILLRTMGTDLYPVLHALEFAMRGGHPQFKDLQMLSFPVNSKTGRIRCNKREIVLSTETERISTLKDSRSIYQYFNSLSGISGFQDHFDWWARNSYTGKGGKPFWVDPYDQNIQHVFIDDNIRFTDDYNIVHPLVFTKKGGIQTRTAPASEFYDCCLIQTDLLNAIANQDYFIKKIQQCEEKYDSYLYKLQS